ncbi:AtzE family amidohydrolase [Baaleninema simplex]|uniref:AtzE family amidohydrolase n=1 Tax=Baaleninema simplex TaxID=2862350 RepID=UPI00034D8C2F|nr:AtzE family amidohydrolase [Baaleninema simplex]
MSFDLDTADAIATAEAVKQGTVSATEAVRAALDRIDRADSSLNCFTTVLGDRALQQANEIDRQRANGERLGSLTGVPFAVKNLFDVEGLTTLAGSKLYASRPPASVNATAITRLQRAGAILLGTLNMDEFAYGFVTENHHYGATRNPHDLTRIAGGSSGGSAAAVAGGLVPLTLGSDTNGSIRVPAALCGAFGLKPTYGRLSRAGTVLFSGSLDCIGPFGRSTRDLAAAFDVLQGADPRDALCTTRAIAPVSPLLQPEIDGIRIAVLGDYFSKNAKTEALDAVLAIANALNATEVVSIPEAARARAAAYLITASEGSNLHLDDLRSQADEFDPATRDRFLAGALIPANWYLQAQRFRTWYRDRLRELFQHVDVLLAPSTPCVAPHLGQKTMVLDGRDILVRPHLGLFTQPISFAGLPVLNVPVRRPTGLPLGVQLIAAPYNEIFLFRVAAFLEGRKSIAAVAPSGNDGAA